MAQTVGPDERLAADEALKLVHTGLLVVMDPSDSIEVAQGPDVLWQFLGIRELEVVDDRDDVAVVLQGGHNLPAQLTLVGEIPNALIQGIGGEDDDKVLGLPHIVEDSLVGGHGVMGIGID